MGPNKLLSGVGQILLFLLASFPFLVPVHITPITTFYNEWWAAAIVLLLVCVTLWKSRQNGAFQLPHIILLPALFIAAIGVQFALGRIFFYQQGLIYANYLLLAASAMLVGRTLVGLLGTERLARSVAAGLTVGALLQVAATLLQLQDAAITGWGTHLVQGYTAYGNIGQRNHLANVLWIGLASLVYLRVNGKIAPVTFALCGCAILFISPYTGSRSIYLYPVSWAILTLLIWKRIGLKGQGRALVGYALALPLLVAVFDLAAIQLPFAQTGIRADSAANLVRTAIEPNSASIRLAQWRIASRAIEGAPLIGNGVGSVPLSSFLNGEDDTYSGPIPVSEHYHNVFFNLGAEFGLPVTVAAAVLVILWLRNLAGVTWSPTTWWLAAVLTVEAIHSMAEYPLWHAYFLAPTALLMGAFDRRSWPVTLGGGKSVAFVLFILLGAYQLYSFRNDHNQLVRIIHLVPSGEHAQTAWRQKLDELLLINRTSMYSPYTYAMLVVGMNVDKENLAEKRRVCEAAMHFSPGESIVFKCAAIAALNGDQTGALRTLRLAMRAYPAQVSNAAADYRQAADRHPELIPLAAFAVPAK